METLQHNSSATARFFTLLGFPPSAVQLLTACFSVFDTTSATIYSSVFRGTSTLVLQFRATYHWITLPGEPEVIVQIQSENVSLLASSALATPIPSRRQWEAESASRD